MTFGARLRAAMDTRGPLCAGIDPHAGLLQAWGLPDSVDGLETFALTAAEALAPVVAAVKPQSAFFERFGSRGIEVLERTVRTCREAGTLLIWSRQTPAVAQRDGTFPITARQLGPVRGAGGTVWVAQPETGSLWRNSGAGWAEQSAYTVGNEYGGLVALGADQVALSSSGNSLFARYDGTSWVRQDTNCGIATPLLFQPPGGMMWMGNTGALLQHR